MCGICGFTWRDEAKLTSMRELLRHRGPDENGSYVDDRVSIGHTRLSIIDLTETGRQPMTSPDGNVVLSYNGEIYNFQDLKKELQAKGHTFRGTSDTEVFIAAWLEWGPQAFSRFNGMWAACICDKRRGILVLTRDRLGDNYAANVDRMSMAHSIEVRSPLLDDRFMEFAARIPVRWKLTPGKTKVLMKELVRGVIPDGIIDREKHGFAGPLGAWIDRNEDALRESVETLHAAGVLDDAWRAFYRDKVFVNPHSIYREYRKRRLSPRKRHEICGTPAPAGATV